MRERWVGGEEVLIACRARSFLEMGASSEIRWRVRVKLQGERETSVGMLRVDFWPGGVLTGQRECRLGPWRDAYSWSRRQVTRDCVCVVYRLRCGSWKSE